MPGQLKKACASHALNSQGIGQINHVVWSLADLEVVVILQLAYWLIAETLKNRPRSASASSWMASSDVMFNALVRKRTNTYVIRTAMLSHATAAAAAAVAEITVGTAARDPTLHGVHMRTSPEKSRGALNKRWPESCLTTLPTPP